MVYSFMPWRPLIVPIPRRSSFRSAFAQRPRVKRVKSWFRCLSCFRLKGARGWTTHLDRVNLVDARSVVFGISSEGDFERSQEHVHARQKTLRRRSCRLLRWLTLENDDTIGQVRSHDEIVFDDESCLFTVTNVSLDDSGSVQTLLGVQVG